MTEPLNDISESARKWLELFRATGAIDENRNNSVKLSAIDQAIAMLASNGVIPPDILEQLGVASPLKIERVGFVTRILRIGRGVSEQDMANAIGISKVQLTRIESLENAPRLDTMINMAFAYGISMSYMFGDYNTHLNVDFGPDVLATHFRQLTRGQTIEEIRDMTGIGIRPLSAIRNGSGRPTDLTIAKIATVYNVPVRELFGENQKRQSVSR